MARKQLGPAPSVDLDAVTKKHLDSVVEDRLRADAAQFFTPDEKDRARANIDAYGSVELGNPETDLVALYTAAKA